MTNKISFRNFLKKFTPISNKFIDDFLDFEDKCKLNIFGINLNEVKNFLEIKNIQSVQRRLIKNFTKSEDYITKRSGSNVEYYVTFETFDKLAMSSNSKNGKNVRDYHVSLFKFIDYYRNDISNFKTIPILY